MNVLIAGAAGFLGGELVKALAPCNDLQIRTVDNLFYKNYYTDFLDKKNVLFHKVDIRDKEKIKALLGWADIVVHLAAIVGDAACMVDVHETQRINYDATCFIRDNFKGKL